MMNMEYRSIFYCSAAALTFVPILNLWGFSGSNPSVPTQEKIEQFLPYVDYQNLRVDTQENTASLSVAIPYRSPCW